MFSYSLICELLNYISFAKAVVLFVSRVCKTVAKVKFSVIQTENRFLVIQFLCGELFFLCNQSNYRNMKWQCTLHILHEETTKELQSCDEY